MNKQAAITPFSLPDRSAEILALVRVAFAEKGFDGASMQDLARAAGMSVGNFYRYFPSKDALVEAMVQLDMAEMERDFAEIRGSGDPLAAVRAKIAEHIRGECADDGRLWAEINAASHRKPQIASICCGMEDMVARNLLHVLGHLSGIGPEAAQARFGPQARLIVLLVKAAAMRRALVAPDPGLDDLILQTIDTQLSSILNAARD